MAVAVVVAVAVDRRRCRCRVALTPFLHRRQDDGPAPRQRRRDVLWASLEERIARKKSEKGLARKKSEKGAGEKKKAPKKSRGRRRTDEARGDEDDVAAAGREEEEAAIQARRRRQREQEEQDKTLKQEMRRQREAAQERRGSEKIGAEAAFEERRRRQVEQEEKDQELKREMRRQKEEARKRRDSVKVGAEAAFEERRRRQFEQEDKDQELKREMRRQREEALKRRGSGKIGAESVLEERRRRQQEQKEKDQELKREMRRQREAARASRQALRLEKQTKKDIDAWHEKHSLNQALNMAMRSPEMEWLSSFYRSDPRWQINTFFNEVAREGGEAPLDENLAASPLAYLFDKANVFTVWRPTSDEAIKNMMLGIATGKGLDIKGKSAKKGNISSYVPFIQISEEPHKEDARAFLIDGNVRVFYQTEEDRIEAEDMLLDLKEYMLFAAQDAMQVLTDEFATETEQELAMKHLAFDENNMNVKLINTYVDSNPPVFGLDITERLFWQAYVIMQDISRPPGTEWESGRGSEPQFMNMNWKPIRAQPEPGDPRAVVYQYSKGSPMEPRTLLMAYEEFGCVKPVVCINTT